MKSTLVFDVGKTDMQDFGWTEAIQGKIKQKHKTKLQALKHSFKSSRTLNTPFGYLEKNKTETVLKATNPFVF